MFNINYKKADEIFEKIETSLEKLKPFQDRINLKNIKEAKDFLEKNIEDFEQTERKLRIGVIGQVKAGKSSFINSLLFNGSHILPKAATPKTANLTVIRYSKTNSLKIEFFSKEEFEDIINVPDSADKERLQYAKEIKGLYEKSGIDIESCRETKQQGFESYEELTGALEEYAGEKGKFTAIIKNISINLDDDRLKDIEIIDTPGMNDPVVSRTEKTRELIKTADVVFFLSPSTQFLDKKDMELLTLQMPQNGIQKLALIGSKFDSAILDEGWNCQSYRETFDKLKHDLEQDCEITYKKYLERSQLKPELAKIIENSLPPVFISSMLHNMVIKDQNKYSEEENDILSELNEMGNDDWGGFKFTQDILKEIANFEKVERLFKDVASKKEQTLQKKLENLFPNAEEKLKNALKDYLERSNSWKVRLENQDLSSLKSQKAMIESEKHKILACLGEISNNIKANLDSAKIDMMKSFREQRRSASDIRERTGTETHTSSRWVSDSKWYNPFSWGTGHTSTSTYTTTYKYCVAADAVENLVEFANSASSVTEANFNKILNRKQVKLKIKKSLIDIMDTESENFSPEYFKMVIEESLKDLDIPILSIDISDIKNSICRRFSGEIRDSSNIANFKSEVSKSLDQIFEYVSTSVENEIKSIFKTIDNMKDRLFSSLAGHITEDMEKLEKELKNKHEEIAQYTKLVKTLNELLNI